MGLFGGLLGWEADDPRLPDSAQAPPQAGIDLEIRIATLHDPHPNTYRLTLHRDGTEHRVVALSTGGGMIEVIEIDGTTQLVSVARLGMVALYFRTRDGSRDYGAKELMQDLVELPVADRIKFVRNKLKRVLGDADKAGAERVYLIGEDERERGVVKVRDLAAKEEHEEPV